MSDVFISYSRSDSRQFVVRLSEALEDRGKVAWVDLEDIPPASIWEDQLREAIAESDSFVFMISPGSAASEHCQRELAEAVKLNKRILPINFAPVDTNSLPASISSHNWIPSQGSFEDDFAASLDTLIKASETDLEWVREHTKLGNSAAAWSAKGQDKSLLLRGNELEEAERSLAEQAGKEPQPTDLQRQFVLASRRGSTRRGRITLGAVGVALIISVGLAVLALVQRHEANQQKELAIARGHAATSRELASNSLGTQKSDPELSLLLATRAIRASDTKEAEEALRTSLAASQLRQALQTGQGALGGAQLSPDGATVATAGADGTVRIWNLRTAKQLQRLVTPAKVVDVAFSPDGRSVVSAGADGTARVWDVKNGQESHVLIDGSALETAGFSPDGRTILTASHSGTVRIWNASNGKEQRVFHVPDAPLWDAEFSPDSHTVVTAGNDGTARVWSAASGTQKAVLGAGSGILYAASFSPDGRRIVTGGFNADVEVWGVSGGKSKRPIRKFPVTGGAVVAVAFSPDGRSVLGSVQDGPVHVWNLRSEGETNLLLGHKGMAFDAEFSPDGREVITAGLDGIVRLWTTGTRTDTLISPGEPMLGGRLSQDGQLAFTEPLHGHSAVIWNARTGQKLSVLRGLAPFFGFAFSRDNASVVTGGRDGLVRVWDANSGKETQVLRGQSGTVFGTEFSADGREVGAGGDNGTARIWDVATGKQLAALRVGNADVVETWFSPNGRLIATGSGNGALAVWDIKTGRKTIVLQRSSAESKNECFQCGIRALMFSPDSKAIATTSADGAVRIWDLATKKPSILRGTTSGLSQVVFSPDSRSVVAGSFDGTAGVWDVRSGKQLETLTGATDVIGSAVFTGNSKSIATLSYDRVVRRYACDVCGASLKDLIALARQRVTRDLTPSERARYLHQQSKNQESSVPFDSLDLQTKVVFPDLADRLSLGRDYGALVTAVAPGSPADRAGLRGGHRTIRFQNTPYRVGGDVILAVDGQKVITTADLSRYIEAMSPGDVADLRILRGGRDRTIELKLPAGAR